MKEKGLNQRFVKHVNFGYNGPKSKAITKMKKKFENIASSIKESNRESSLDNDDRSEDN